MPLVVLVTIAASVQCVLRQGWCPYRYRLMSAPRSCSSFQINEAPEGPLAREPSVSPTR